MTPLAMFRRGVTLVTTTLLAAVSALAVTVPAHAQQDGQIHAGVCRSGDCACHWYLGCFEDPLTDLLIVAGLVVLTAVFWEMIVAAAGVEVLSVGAASVFDATAAEIAAAEAAAAAAEAGAAAEAAATSAAAAGTAEAAAAAAEAADAAATAATAAEAAAAAEEAGATAHALAAAADAGQAAEAAVAAQEAAGAALDTSLAADASPEVWAKAVNPNFDLMGGQGPYNTNCGWCFDAVNGRLEGVDAEAIGGVEGSFEDIGTKYGSQFDWSSSIQQIESDIGAAGPGARGAVGIEPGAGSGLDYHILNVANIGGRVVFIEGQSGTLMSGAQVAAAYAKAIIGYMPIMPF
jgi:hypothetical protein